MKLKGLLVFWIVLLTGAVSPVLAEEAGKEFIFKYINESHGLSNNHVHAIFKDKLGFMWFGTGYGLNRFDGTRMRTFLPDDKDSSSISSSYISSIYGGPEGNLWIKNVNGLFDIYLINKGVFNRNINTFAREYKLRSDMVLSVNEDKLGRYWFAHPNEGISVFDPKTGESRYLVQNSYEPGHLKSNQIAALTGSPNGEIWVLHDSGAIDVLNPFSLAVIERFELGTFPRNNSRYVFELFADSDGDAWVYSTSHDLGIFLIEREDGRVHHFHQKSKEYPLNNDLIKTMAENTPGEIWLGTDHGGINIIHKGKHQVSRITHDADEAGGLPENTVYALLKDSDGIMWVGTTKKGVAFYHEGMMRFSHVKKGAVPGQGLPYNDINVVVEDKLGNLYLGTNGAGLLYFERSTGTYRQFLAAGDRDNSLPGNVIVDLKIDHDGILWIGTYLHGLASFDGRKFKKYTHIPDDPSSLSDVNVWKIYIDKSNRVWVGTLRSGVNLFDRKTGSFRRLSVGGADFPLNNQYISSFAEDLEGNLWIGGGYGIDIINLETGYHRYISASDASTGLNENNVTEILFDSKGIIWITSGKGLNYFDKTTGRFNSYSKPEGITADFLVSLLEDEDNNLWISTQNGLSYAVVNRNTSPFTISFRNFDVTDGLQAGLFNKNSAFKTSQGEMIFGGPNGYNIFKTSNFAFELNEPKVVFTGLSLFNKPIRPDEVINGRVILEDMVSNVGKVAFKHYQNVISVDFSALNYINFEKNKFRYKLEGFNQDWTVLDEAPFRVVYTNLDPGTYKLVVQAAKNDGHWGAPGQKLEIKIEAPFWKTPLAYLLYFLLVVAAIWYARKRILDKERENFKRLEEKREAQRILELDQMKTRFFTNISHEFKTPLSLILAPVEHLLHHDEASARSKQYLTIQRNAKRLLQLVNQILDIKNIEKEGVVLHLSEGDIVRFIDNKVREFAELSEKRHIQLSFDSSIKRLPTQFDADKIEKIIFNLLSNAFKFTPEDGQIRVTLGLKAIDNGQGVLALKVIDTGSGIKETDLPKIFDRFYTASPSKEISNPGSGIGLSLVREFARIHGGDIAVRSQLGEGSEFELTIKVHVKPELLDLGNELTKTTLPKEVAIDENDSDKPLVLLVEDNLEFRQYIMEYLEQDYRIVMAQDGKDGLEKALANIPDIIISDLMMPLMDGVELCQEIKKDLKTSHIPVIILTARSSEEKQLEGIKSGCNLFISKPFKLEILTSGIKNLLQERVRLQKHYRKRISVNASEQEIESMDDKLIHRAMQVVESNLDDPEFSVEQMSKDLGMSRVHLYKKLSALTGKSPVEFIRLVRLQRAAQMLQKSQLTVAEIAYQVGFNNAKYFAKHFKAEFGVLPSQYSQKTATPSA